MMRLAETQNGAAEQIELHRELRRCCRIEPVGDFVQSKDASRVAAKIEDRDEPAVTDRLQSGQSEVPLFWKRDIEARDEERRFGEGVEFASRVEVIVVEEALKLRGLENGALAQLCRDEVVLNRVQASHDAKQRRSSSLAVLKRPDVSAETDVCHIMEEDAHDGSGERNDAQRGCNAEWDQDDEAERRSTHNAYRHSTLT